MVSDITAMERIDRRRFNPPGYLGGLSRLSSLPIIHVNHSIICTVK